MAVAGEVTQHGRAHPNLLLITIVSLKSKDSQESDWKNHRSEWKLNSWGMFLIVTCQHASGACQSYSRPIFSLHEALRKYVELSPNTPLFLTLQFCEKNLTPTPNLLQIRLILPLLGHIFSVPSRSFGWHGSVGWSCKSNILGSHHRCPWTTPLTSLQRLVPLVVLKKSARLSPVLMCISRVSPIATNSQIAW